jgi:hypothetical protein
VVEAKDVTSEHLRLGALLLGLVSDWDSWVSRRVDGFYFAGDDERVLHRKQSVDFALPERLTSFDSPLIQDYGGHPVPVTFVTKWRLPEFSLRDHAGHAASLMQREDSVVLAAAMLVVLGTLVKSKGSDLSSPIDSGDEMPEELRTRLYGIVSGEPDASLQSCIDFQDTRHTPVRTREWRQALARNELFMSLAYELSRGFLLTAVVPQNSDTSRHVLKFSYNSYVVPVERDPWLIKLGHLGRFLETRSRDAIDPSYWRRSAPRRRRWRIPRKRVERAVLTISSGCEDAPSQIRYGAPAVACAIAQLTGPNGQQNIRIRPSGIVSLRGLPAGDYSLSLSSRSGYSIEPKLFEFRAEPGTTTRVHLRCRRYKFARYQTRAAPRTSSAPMRGKKIARGFGWNSKPLVIRVRLGGGGSYHCEFEAPAGLHVTRGKLVSNLDGNEPEKSDVRRERIVYSRARYVDTVLESTQRAHLYAPVREGGPSTGYVFLNLRPRAETIVRPATLTALFTLAVLGILSFLWLEPPKGFEPDDPPLALLAILLGGPGGLAAYFAQAVPSRVTNAMLYGVRLVSLVPFVISLMAAGAILGWGENAGWPILGVAGIGLVATLALLFTYWFSEHPREQRPVASRQGLEFEETHIEHVGPAIPMPRSQPDPQLSAADAAVVIRDRMLERSGGLTAATRAKLLWQRWFFLWETEVPPALYFDSAEAPAVFLGPASGIERNRLRSAIDEFCAQFNTDQGVS